MPGSPAPHLRGATNLDARIRDLVARQRTYFESGATFPLHFREQQLATLSQALRKHERQLLDALHDDLRKNETEAYTTEIGFLHAEIRHTLRHVAKWMRPHNAFSPLVIAPSRGALHYQPLGTNLILAAWNYPLQLSLAPLIGAIAAGNVAVVKPSELAPATSSAIAELVSNAFAEEYVACVEGDVVTSQTLLAQAWDHIFFTGSTQVGRIVARAAADQLARCTLELGGKSPAIVMPSADLDVAARRIVWGKFTNAGQTCVAPDYMLIHESIHDTMIERMVAAIRRMYGSDPRQSPDLGRIVNDRHFSRLLSLIDRDKVVFGGDHDASDRYISPTLLAGVDMTDKIMADEIFGPILPIMRFSSLKDAISIVGQRPHPLALYLFTRDSDDEASVIERVSFGGGCINNTLVHLGDPNLPFGGVGPSGLGAYHGKFSFETFSHRKGVVKTANFLDPDVKYPPYNASKLGVVRKLLG